MEGRSEIKTTRPFPATDPDHGADEPKYQINSHSQNAKPPPPINTQQSATNTGPAAPVNQSAPLSTLLKHPITQGPKERIIASFTCFVRPEGLVVGGWMLCK